MDSCTFAAQFTYMKLFNVIFSLLLGFTLSLEAQVNLTPGAIDSILDGNVLSDSLRRKLFTSEELGQLNFATSDILDEEVSSQDISALLQSSKDPLLQAASFNFNGLRYRFRGYGADETGVLVNGINMSDPVSGWGLWSVWGGLNDVTRYQYSVMGLGSYSLGFSGLGGASNIDARASSVRKGTRVSYALTNRNYRNRLMVTHASGMNSKGWSYVLSGSLRYASEGYVEGTYYNSASYFAAVEKKLNERHSLNLSLMGAPTEQSLQGAAVQEIYTLLGDPYYNPYWGLQNGKKRNIRERYRHQPLAILTHYFKVNDQLKLMTSAYALTGINGTTNINWYDAKDPRPNYYRYLPSYYNEPTDEEIALNTQVTDNWLNDINTRQVNWDYLYFANSKNLYTVQDAEGTLGNTVTGNRSKYIIEEYREDPTTIGLNNNFTYKVNNQSVLHGGLSVRTHKTKNFKVLDDLLGGDFWVDVDQFAEQDFVDAQVSQNDLNNTNNLIYKGDKLSYDFDLQVNNSTMFLNYDISFKRIDAYAAAQLAQTSFWRVGHMLNGRFPNNSFGKSAVNNYLTPGFKAGLIFKLSGIQYLTLNGAYTIDAPVVDFAYVSPRFNDVLVPGVSPIKSLSTDASYFYRSPMVKARVTGFMSDVRGQVYSRVFYHDEFRNFVYYTMSGVNTLHTGIEASADVNVTASWSITGAYTKGEYIYNSRPSATIVRNNTSTPLAENRTIYLKNYRLGGTPQTLGSLGFKYSGKQFWFAGLNVSYFDDYYVEVNPDRRTAEALDKYVVSDPQWEEILDQEKLPSAFLLNAFAGKSFKIKSSYLNINLSINNLLNDQTIKATGYEQLRYDANEISKFPSMYIYLNGISYFGMITYRF